MMRPSITGALLGALDTVTHYSWPTKGPGALRGEERIAAKLAAHPPLREQPASRQVTRCRVRKFTKAAGAKARKAALKSRRNPRKEV